MKSTGIVRRIDELGRIVIPKEIRNNLRINETDHIEIYVENESIVLKKYSLMKSLNDLASTLVDSISNNIKKEIIITDNSNIISCSNFLKKQIKDKCLSEEMLNYIKRRENLTEKYKKEINITKEYKVECSYIIKSILNNGDVVGLFILLDLKENINSNDELISTIAVQFLNKYLDK